MGTADTWLIQLLLPTRDNDQQPIEERQFSIVRAALANHFGGVTAYQRSPARGLWKAPSGAVEGDDVVMVEVQAQTLDRQWWEGYRRELEREFRQEAIVVRASRIETL